ncbi:MAG: GNAT family N-acetyltransferase [Pseudomonadota bacterium]
MQPPHIATASDDRRAAIQHTMTLGFSNDPITRWLWPDSHVYLTHFPRFSGAFGGACFEHGTVYETDCKGAAAMWLPPGEQSDGDTMEEILGASIDEERMEEIGAFFAGMDEYHPHEDHYYLAIIAADPAQTGRGLGAALMKHALAKVDETGLPAYLESSNPRNISLYERHGFEVMGEIQVGSSPVMTPMYRPARR